MGRMVLEAMKTAVEKVGTAVLTTVAQTLSGAVNEINAKIPGGASASNKLVANDDSRLSNSRPASDVHAWAKRSTPHWVDLRKQTTVTLTSHTGPYKDMGAIMIPLDIPAEDSNVEIPYSNVAATIQTQGSGPIMATISATQLIGSIPNLKFNVVYEYAYISTVTDPKLVITVQYSYLK